MKLTIIYAARFVQTSAYDADRKKGCPANCSVAILKGKLMRKLSRCVYLPSLTLVLVPLSQVPPFLNRKMYAPSLNGQ